MKDKEINKVYTTKEYNKFRIIAGNRPIGERHVANIAESMGVKPLVNPIIVNEKFEIIDGQHRFSAYQHLGESVPYIINEGYGVKEVVLLNENQRNWSLLNFHEQYVQAGNVHYVALQKFMDRFRVSLSTALILSTSKWFGGGAVDVRQAFKQGLYEWKNEREAIDVASKYNAIRDQWSFSCYRPFVLAFKKIVFKVDWKRFVHQCQNHPYIVERQSTVHQYSRLFEKLYNHRRRDRQRITDPE